MEVQIKLLDNGKFYLVVVDGGVIVDLRECEGQHLEAEVRGIYEDHMIPVTEASE